jgi:two-component system, OmpR family, response regulator MtrA
MSAAPLTPLLDPVTENDTPAPAAETTVLVIDDDPVMWSMLSMLGREYGFTVKTASDGIEGLQLAEQSDCRA